MRIERIDKKNYIFEIKRENTVQIILSRIKSVVKHGIKIKSESKMPRKSSLNKSIKVEKPAEPVAQDEEIFEVEAILEKRILAGKVRRKKNA